MKTMKMLLTFALLIALLWIFSDIVIYFSINGTYKPKEAKVYVSTPEVTITESKATYINGVVKGTIKNNTEKIIDGTYLKIDMYSPRDVNLGTEYIKECINDFNPKEIQHGINIVEDEQVMELAKEKNIHTCIDSSGIAYNPNNEEWIKKLDHLITLTDLVMLDIKHIDPEKHKELTAQPNTNILKFAEYLDEKQVPMWIRHVVVPGLTDDDKYLCYSLHIVFLLLFFGCSYFSPLFMNCQHFHQINFYEDF